MALFRVHLVKPIFGTAVVDAQDETEAIEQAIEMMPADLCANCCGGASMNQPWIVDGSPSWQPLDEFYGEEYDEKADGITVEPA
jgi:hypothetical protein